MATPQARLTATEPVLGEATGRAVAVSNDVAVVGVSLRHTAAGQTGAVHVYRRGANGWLPEAELLGYGLQPYARFGDAVALAGDVLVVGAPGQKSLFAYFFEGLTTST
jgi:FG-GAP repeat